jgi:hypothetical protein
MSAPGSNGRTRDDAYVSISLQVLNQDRAGGDARRRGDRCPRRSGHWDAGASRARSSRILGCPPRRSGDRGMGASSSHSPATFRRGRQDTPAVRRDRRENAMAVIILDEPAGSSEHYLAWMARRVSDSATRRAASR